MTSVRQPSDDRLEDQPQSARNLVSELQRAIDQREVRLEAVTVDLRDARAELARVQSSLAVMHRSLSWRWTAPFRLLARMSAAVLAPARVERLEGRTPMRSLEPDGRPSLVAAGTCFDFLFLLGHAEAEPAHHRAYSQIESLRSAGLSVVAFAVAEAARLAASGIWASRVVLSGVEWGDALRGYFSFAREKGSVFVIDLDDLGLDPDSPKSLRAFDRLARVRRSLHVARASTRRALLLRCDRATAPTESLAARIAELGKPVDVVPDTLSAAQIALVETGVMHKPVAGSPAVIGYFGGAEAEANFAACEPALLRALGEHPGARLRIVGRHKLSSAFDGFSERIERLPVPPEPDMLAALAEIDINLVPLEAGNLSSESRSQFKIVEAGLVGVPTIASRVASHEEAVEHGVDGFLAEGTDEWHAAFEQLLSSAQLRAEIGHKARDRALRQFGPATLLRSLQRVYELAPPDLPPVTSFSPKLEPGDGLPRAAAVSINFIVPGLIIGGGGHRNILRAAYHLSRFGHDIRLCFIGTTETAETLTQLIREHFFPLECPVTVYAGEMTPADVIFATHWSTIATALEQRARCSEILYFVQDFEPMFYPMGSDYIMAENTYRLGLYHITSGPWCADILRRHYNAEADSFVFPIQTDNYWQRPRTQTGSRLLFFAKPEMPRRCFELGVEALRILNEARPSLEIVTFGSDLVSAEMLPFPTTRKGLVHRLDELAVLYSNAELGIAFSPTNPSLVPFEMLACGLPVVDLDRLGAEVNFGNRRDIALLADPEPRTFAKQVLALLDNEEERKRRSLAGLEFVKTFPDEEGMARRFEYLVLNRLRKNARLAAD